MESYKVKVDGVKSGDRARRDVERVQEIYS
jgi:hypothetical protein